MEKRKQLDADGVEAIPFYVIVRNIVSGSMAKKLGLREGMEIRRPIIEVYYKGLESDDSLINEDHILVLGYCTDQELIQIRSDALRINEALLEYFDSLGFCLVDFKLEFGRLKGEVVLSHNITPDTCCLWDKKTYKPIDGDQLNCDFSGVEKVAIDYGPLVPKFCT